ncbi:MAG: hypothetical protein V1685_07260 [Parcubacteria group bacterium]
MNHTKDSTGVGSLATYIEDNLRQGISAEEIKKALVGIGWPLHDVEEALRFATQEKSNAPSLSAELPQASGKVGPKLVKSFILGLVIILIAGGGYYAWSTGMFTGGAPENILNELAQVTSASFMSSYITNEAIQPDTKIFQLSREGRIILPESFQYKNGISPLPEDKEEREALLANLELAGLYLMFQGADAIGTEGRVFYRYDTEALVQARVIDPEDAPMVELLESSETSSWIEGRVGEEGRLFIPDEMYYLKNLKELAKDIKKVNSTTYEGMLSLTGIEAIQRDMSSSFGVNLSSPNANIDVPLSKLSDVHREALNKSTIRVELEKGNIRSIVINSYESIDPQIIRRIEFTGINTASAIAMPEVSDEGSLAARDAEDRDYFRGSSTSLIASVIRGLYAGRNSFPIVESAIRLDDFEHPVVKNLLATFVESRKSVFPDETDDEAERYWKDELSDPLPEQYYYSYQSIDNGDGFSITYIQEKPNYQTLGSRIEQCVNLEDVCTITETVTGKAIRDDVRRYRINEIVASLSALKTAGNLQSFPILTNARFGTEETQAVDALLKTSRSLSKYKETNVLTLPKSYDDLVRDIDYPNNYYLYTSDGQVFSVKVKLENTPEENNQETLLKDFCESSGTIFKRSCIQEGTDWYLVEENTRID